MVRYNTTVKREKVINYEGGRSYKGDEYLQLYLTTTTQIIMNDKFYGKKEEQYKEWIDSVQEMAKKDPKFLLQLAAYVRNELKLRTAPIAMLVETVLQNKDNMMAINQMVFKYGEQIIQRADEPAEIIAYYISVRGKIGTDTPKFNGLPHVLKQLINKVILSDKFNEYQIIKNDKNNSSVKFRDVLRICHPRVKDDTTRKFFGRIVKQDSFPEVSEDTWEGIISQKGSNKESWTEAVQVMPMFAMLRNIRNLLDNDVPYSFIKRFVIDKLNDVEAVRKSRILPFRFYQAYKTISHRNDELDRALENAVLSATMNNIPNFDGKTAVFVDVSGSMTSRLNDKSEIQYNEIAALFGAIMFKKCGKNNIVLAGYDDHFYLMDITADTSIFNIVDTILKYNGGATYAYLPMKFLLLNNIRVDRILYFSDVQSYNQSGWGSGGETVESFLNRYRFTINPNVVLYDVDLTGYGTCQTNTGNEKNVHIGGWSERIFDLMQIYDNVVGVDIKSYLEQKYPS